ncbi:MAG: gluconokinase [Burkholderiales bacterium]|nr:gluconokinase [Burkholderiales bacterium]
MGVSGSGKSTVAAGIAAALGLHFIDGDGLHSPESVARMQAGTPLTDADRWPWLGRIAGRLADELQSPRGIVIACSALRRAYRDRIRVGAPGVRFVFLDGPADIIRARMAGRSGHYMPESLLASQLATLEPPGAEEGDAQRFDIAAPPEAVIASAVRWAAVPFSANRPGTRPA